ncbi:MAG: O-antigen ligase domain-containing protein [Burkholderiaceae bacterium]|nr:MAG: O-antigen ligase domain-containing protein [Burkholderiaceae bacterium]
MTLDMSAAPDMKSRRPRSYMHVIFYVILFMVALATLLSKRSLDSNAAYIALKSVEPTPPLVALTQPIASLLLLTVAAERILVQFVKSGGTTVASPALLGAYVLFWGGTVAAPGLWGAHPQFTHDFFYTLVIGIAAVLITGTERDLAIKAARDALLVFMAVGVALIPIKTNMVLDTTYTQGLIPGLPRFGGLAPSPVGMGALAQVCLVCLLALPYRRASLNRIAWGLALAVLFVAQSKTAWLCFILSSGLLIAFRSGPSFWRRFSDPMRPELGVLCVLVFIAGVLALALFLIFGHVDNRVVNFFSSSEGEQLTSLTGRTQIWAVAYAEWLRHPVFGYGPSIWDVAFRNSVGMPNATHAHNQFMDALSRSGAVGAASFVIYALVLFVLSLRYASSSRGLTLALFVIIALRSVAEVPLSLYGYGIELITHLLLLMTLAAAASDARQRKDEKRVAASRRHAALALVPNHGAQSRFVS